MEIITNYQFIKTRQRLGSILSFIGIAVLVGGFLLTLNNTNQSYQTLALISLPLGFAISQGGLYFANRFVRTPNTSDAIDQGFDRIGKKAGRGVRLYHYVLPTPHVILSPSGVIVIIPRFQGGTITADGYEWKQKLGFFQRLFGQQTLPNPAVEAESRIKQIAGWISNNVPELAETELPIAAIIVITRKEPDNLDLAKSTIPAVHYTKLKGLWKQSQQATDQMSEETYDQLQAAFDAEAEKKGLLESDDE